MPRERAEDLGVGIQGAATAQARCDATLVELVAQFDEGTGWGWFEGVTSCAHWLAWACSMSPGTAREHVRVARALRSMPMVAARFADGDLTFSKVRELSRLAGRVDEAELCQLALDQTASQLARTIRSYRAHAGTHMPQLERRRLTWKDTEEGMVRLSVTLLPEEAAVVRGALEAATDRQLAASSSSDRSDGTSTGADGDSGSDGALTSGFGNQPTGSNETSTEEDGHDPAAPVQIDPVAGLCAVARCYLDATPTSATDDPDLVVIHVGLETLADPTATSSTSTSSTATTASVATAEGDEVAFDGSTDVPAGTFRGAAAGRSARAWIERGGPIEAQTAARHVCDAPLVGLIVDRNGDVLAMGRSRRLASPSQRRALRVRDGACRFPGCRQHRRLIPHHIIPWAQGGPTDLPNLILLCQAHHTYVHEGGVDLTGRPGAWVFTLPDGQVISTGQHPDPDTVEQIVQHAAREAAAQPDRLFPVEAGQGFQLHACVQRLFDIELPDDLPVAA